MSTGPTAEDGLDSGGHVQLNQEELEQLRRALTLREADLLKRESVLREAEKRSDDLREANSHLVLATLAAEQLEEAARNTRVQQDEFLAMLAHELRNPLAPIRSAVSLLELSDSPNPSIQKVSKIVSRQVALMASLLDDLLDASRVTRGKVTLHRKPVSVSDFIDQAVAMNQALFDARRQHFKLELPATPVHVDGDPVRLTQVVGNLLNNAAKYTPKGGTIALSVAPKGDNVLLRLVDNGSGISETALPHVFDLFTQEERSLSRSQGGLGIGLTVVRKMVELHGGTVEVRSAGLGKGSEFTVMLPRMNYVEEESPKPVNENDFVPARIFL